MRCRRLLPLVVALLCAAVPLSFADQVVYFVKGKAIMVKSVEKGEKFTILEMEGGGRIGVPTEQIVKIEDFVVSAPSTAGTAPVQAAPQVAATPGSMIPPPTVAAGGPQSGVPSGLPAVPPMVPGPGMGGRPSGGPNENLAGIKPLEVGGNNPAGAMQRRIPLSNPGPGSGGPGGSLLGMGAARQNFAAGRRFGGRAARPGGGRGERPAELTRAVPPPPAAQSTPPPQSTQPSVAQPPAPSVEPQEPPPPPDDSNEEPSDPPAPDEGDSSGNTPGSAS